MDRQYERIAYRKIPHLNLFLNRIQYRSVHFHNAFELLCLFRGNCTVTMPDKTILASSGDVILINHNVAHEIRAKDSADFVVIQFSRHTFIDYFPLIRTTFFDAPNVCGGMDKESAAKLWRHICDLCEAYLSDGKTAPLRCVSGLSELIGFLFDRCPYTVYTQEQYEGQKKIEQRMQRIIDRINTNYDNKLLLSEIADSEGITIAHLSHLFHDRLGVTFRDYLNNFRFENAVRLLSNESLNISDVALTCGFSDVKYMTKMFKERFGQTPAEYRKRHGPSDGGKAFPDEYFYGKEESRALIREYVKPLSSPSGL